jgi:hypothetical protein
MVVSAARTDPRVARLVRRLESRTPVIADVVRATGAFCERERIPCPSYEQVRLLVHAARERRARRRAAVDLVIDVELRARPPEDLLHLFDDPRAAPRRRR